MEPISVLFFLSNLKGGGAERVALNLLNGFQSESIEPSLFLLRNQIDYDEEYHQLSNKISINYATKDNERMRNKLPENWKKCNNFSKKIAIY
jgi:hypothetical protein